MSGDTIFCGNCGRTDLPTGSMKEMQESLRKIILHTLPDDTQIFLDTARKPITHLKNRTILICKQKNREGLLSYDWNFL